MNELLRHSATSLARMIRERQLTAVEVVEAHIRHIQATNPALNAVVVERFADARAEALEADRRVLTTPAAELPPLCGVPCTIKESFAVRGLPQTSGLVARRAYRAAEDAPTVARLRRAGAIVVGLTNTSELCMWMESHNRVYGRSNNPYDQRRIVGGSSGGEGAIIGAGGVPFGLGADIGGSIRMPAFFNGVFGHKATGGLIDNQGQYPLPAPAAMRYLCTGPLCRRAEDLMPLLRVLSGDPTLPDPGTVSLAGLPVLLVEGNGRQRVSRDLIDAMHRAAQALSDRCGVRVRTAQVQDLRHSLEIWGAMLAAAGGPSYAEILGDGIPVRAGRQFLRLLLGRSPHTLPSLALAAFEKVPQWFEKRAEKFLALGQELRQVLVALIGEQGVLLYPPYVSPAPRHLQPLWPPFNWAYTAIFNMMELPVTQVPLGLNRSGLPLGVQVAAVHGQDHRTIAVALELERLLGGWIPPPLALRAREPQQERGQHA